MTAAAFDSSLLNEPLREVRLYGALGKRFGRVHRLAVATAGEAVAALCAVAPGFQAWLAQHNTPGYRVWIRGAAAGPKPVGLAPERLADPVGTREVICIVPVVAGAKRQGLGNVIAGLVLIAAGAVYGYFTWDPDGTYALWNAGAVMAFGGVLTMLTAPRLTKRDERVQTPSYGFDGPVNTDAEGLPVPVVYGRVITGGARISAGISTDELVNPSYSGGSMGEQDLPTEQPLDPYDYGASGG